MKHSKIFLREDGSEVEIYTMIRIESSAHDYCEITWLVDVAIKSPIEKEFHDCCDGMYDHGYRKSSKQARLKRKEERILEFVTKEEIQEVKIELWEKLKPEQLK